MKNRISILGALFLAYSCAGCLYVHYSRSAHIYVYPPDQIIDSSGTVKVPFKLATSSGRIKYFAKSPVADSIHYLSWLERDTVPHPSYWDYSKRTGDGWCNIQDAVIEDVDTAVLKLDSVLCDSPKNQGHGILYLTVRDTGIARIRIVYDSVYAYNAVFMLSGDSILAVQGGMKTAYTRRRFSRDTVSRAVFRGRLY